MQVDTQSERKELVLSERQARAAQALAGLNEGDTVKGEVRAMSRCRLPAGSRQLLFGFSEKRDWSRWRGSMRAMQQ